MYFLLYPLGIRFSKVLYLVTVEFDMAVWLLIRKFVIVVVCIAIRCWIYDWFHYDLGMNCTYMIDTTFAVQLLCALSE